MGILTLWVAADAAGSFAAGDRMLGRAADLIGNVRAVVATDTVILEDGQRIKLIGLRALAPPRRKPAAERDEYGFVIEQTDPQTPIEEQAHSFCRHLLEGRDVRLEFDLAARDDRGTTLAYVFILPDEIFANAEILRQGYADLHLKPPNIKYDQRLRAAYQEARREKRGIQGE